MIRIVVSRSGGFAGLTRTWTVEVSEAEAEQRWLPLLDELESGSIPDDGRDRYVYHVTVGYREVDVGESAVQGPWKELVERAKQASPDKPEEAS